jgi:hypothetical protein
MPIRTIAAALAIASAPTAVAASDTRWSNFRGWTEAAVRCDFSTTRDTPLAVAICTEAVSLAQYHAEMIGPMVKAASAAEPSAAEPSAPPSPHRDPKAAAAGARRHVTYPGDLKGSAARRPGPATRRRKWEVNMTRNTRCANC